jgi:mRNA-degrading endonuclease RelE of RelBE toxin-antitoxin system
MSLEHGLRKWQPLEPKYKPSALQSLRKIEKVYGRERAERIIQKFEEFAQTGRGDVCIFRRLDKGLELRVGRFRAILQIEDGIIRMIVVGMKKTQKI